MDSGLGWFVQAWEAGLYGLECVSPFAPLTYRDALRWDYHHYDLFEELSGADPENSGPFVVTWDEALKVMERETKVDQPFRWSVLRSAFANLRYLSAAAQDALKPAAAMREVLRACWNKPSTSGFVWKHPFVRAALRPDRRPWLDPDGNLVLIWDTANDSRSLGHIVDDVFSIPCFVFDIGGGV